MRSPFFARRGILTTIILSFIIAVLAGVGGFAYYGFTSTGADGRYGSVSMPGQAIMQLPAGALDITYTYDLDTQVVDIPGFNISVVSVSTSQQAFVHFQNGSASDVNGVTYAPVGSVHIPAAGKYRVLVTDTNPGVPNPQLRFGISDQHSFFQTAGFVIAGLLLLNSGVLAILRRRAMRRRAAEPYAYELAAADTSAPPGQRQ